jgi:hypothetical protein
MSELKPLWSGRLSHWVGSLLDTHDVTPPPWAKMFEQQAPPLFVGQLKAPHVIVGEVPVDELETVTATVDVALELCAMFAPVELTVVVVGPVVVVVVLVAVTVGPVLVVDVCVVAPGPVLDVGDAPPAEVVAPGVAPPTLSEKRFSASPMPPQPTTTAPPTITTASKSVLIGNLGPRI